MLGDANPAGGAPCLAPAGTDALLDGFIRGALEEYPT